jgi:predicted MFS family arabinose efflux permease
VTKISLHPSKTIFDGWRSISISLFMTLVGYGVLVGVPVISAAWVGLLGFSEEQVGRVAGADLGGLSAGATLTALLIKRVNRRVLVLLGLGIAVAANGLCITYQDYDTVLWLRLMAGFGSGIYTAVAVATLGGSSKPAWAFNLMLFAFAFSQAGEMHILPMLSMNGIYMLFIGCYLATLPFIHWIPAHPIEPALDVELDIEEGSGEHHVEHRHVPAYLPWLCLTAIFFTYINIGTYWTYIELAALDAGIAEDWIVPLLTWVSLGSIVGCLVATVISNRFGLAKPLLVSLVIMALIVGILSDAINHRNLMISLIGFNLLWIFIDVYQMSTVAVIDKSGSFASMLPAVQGLGQIVGPNIAASMLAAGLGYNDVFLMCSGAAIIGMLVYLVMYIFLKRQVPELVGKSSRQEQEQLPA